MLTRSSRKFAPTLSACAPRSVETFSTSSKVSRSRAVGDVVAVPKLATPEMLTAGPASSLTGAARRLRVYCDARLVQRARRERRHEARGEGLVAVGERRAAAHGVQAADVARVEALDLVEVVARRELVPLIRPLVEAEQKIRRVEARGHDARRDARPRVTRLVEARVDGRDGRGRDRDDGRVVQARLLEVREEEGAVARERPAEGSPVLRLRERVFGRRERVARVEPLAAQEPVDPPAIVVRPRAGDDVDDPARRAPELRDAARGDDLELADDLLAVEGAGEVGRVVVRREAVHDEAVVDEALPRDGESGAGDGRGLGKALVGDGVRARHARRERGEVEVVAPIQRQTVDLLRRDRLGQLRARRLDDGHVRLGHPHALRHAGHRQRERHFERLPDREREPPAQRREARPLDPKQVSPDGEVGEPVTPLVVGRRGSALVGLGVRDGDGRAGQGRAVRVQNSPADGGGGHRRLPPRAPRAEGQEQQRAEDERRERRAHRS